MTERRRIAVSNKTIEMIQYAKGQIRGWKGQTARVTDAEALDWLLEDIKEYGSPVVKSWARSVYRKDDECRHGRKLNEDDCLACSLTRELDAKRDPTSAPGTTPS